MADPNILKAVQAALSGSKERERKFNQSVDLAINLKNIDLAIPKNRIEDELPLPHGRGKSVKVGIFASGDLATKAKKVADVVVQPQEMGDLATDKKRFKKLVNSIDYFLAEAPLMPTIGKTLGVVLGPRGKMPRPIPPTADPTALVDGLKRTVRLRSKDRRTFHTVVGSEDMGAEKITENVEVVLKRLESRLEQGRNNIHSIFVKTTMGPATKVI
ncbi:MAG: 50S ribosomal protein L1 [Euryarchaeota archaeon]|nr:50S ribosomal protein L1 [Euryarchaeota archaeon]